MVGTPEKSQSKNESDAPETVAELLFYLSNPKTRQELEEFRIEYEALNGPTDLTKHYTSTWPQARQDWLFENYTKLWFDGLPPFAKAYLRGKMELAARDGKLDDLSDKLLQLYVAGDMKLRHTPGR